MMLDSGNKGMIKSFRIALLVLGAPWWVLVEKAGEKIDQAAESAKDKLNPEGSAEKAGRKIDQAVENATDK